MQAKFAPRLGFASHRLPLFESLRRNEITRKIQGVRPYPPCVAVRLPWFCAFRTRTGSRWCAEKAAVEGLRPGGFNQLDWIIPTPPRSAR
jgi:hypothetical protein